MKRGTAQVLFRYTPGAIFKEKGLPWSRAIYMELRSNKRRYPSLMRALNEYLQPWLEATPAARSLWPDPIEQSSRYAVGPVERVFYEAFPLVFYCRICKRMHWYSSTQDMARVNPTGACKQGCSGENLLRQYPYSYIHAAGDLQPLVAPSNDQGNYRDIRMNDTGKFRTSYWMGPRGQRMRPRFGDGLGLRVTPMSILPGSRAMRGIHLGQPEKFISHTLSVVDIDDERISRRMEHSNFGEIQLGSYFEMPSFTVDEYPHFFEQILAPETVDPFLATLEQQLESGMLPQATYEALRAQYLSTKQAQPGGKLSALISEVRDLIANTQIIHRVVDDTSLNEYLYCRYDLDPECRYTLGSLRTVAQEQGDHVDLLALDQAEEAAYEVGLCDLTLHEKFPVLLAAVGYSRVKYQPGQVVLRPFAPKQNDEFQRFKIPIPVTETKNEAVMFSLDPCRVVAFLRVNKLAGTIPAAAFSDRQLARAWLYQYLPLINEGEMANAKLGQDSPTNAAILIFRLLHTVTHLIMHAGKKYVGLEMDSLAEFLFPSALSAAIYVSKHTQFSLGALVTTFRHDLGRWLVSMRGGAAACLFDPVCRGRTGACHACAYLKFSCQHHNHGLNRGLLLGSPDIDGLGPLVGYWSPAVASLLELR